MLDRAGEHSLVREKLGFVIAAYVHVDPSIQSTFCRDGASCKHAVDRQVELAVGHHEYIVATLDRRRRGPAAPWTSGGTGISLPRLPNPDPLLTQFR
jgi:hypothetical protein